MHYKVQFKFKIFLQKLLIIAEETLQKGRHEQKEKEKVGEKKNTAKRTNIDMTIVIVTNILYRKNCTNNNYIHIHKPF